MLQIYWDELYDTPCMLSDANYEMLPTIPGPLAFLLILITFPFVLVSASEIAFQSSRRDIKSVGIILRIVLITSFVFFILLNIFCIK
jgi:hypothetical protein